MPSPTLPTVSPELWRTVLERLSEFRSIEPWNWVPDSALSAYIDAAGQPWFACVLGNGGQVFGLCLYRGAAGLRLYREVQAFGDASTVAEYRYHVDAITVWYEAKSAMERRQRELFEGLGYRPKRGDRMGWPAIRSHRPGFFPWYPDESELSVLVEVVPRLLRFAEMYRGDPDCYHERGAEDLPTLPQPNTQGTLHNLEWRTWVNPPAEQSPPPVPVNPEAPNFRRAAALPSAPEVLELDWFFTPEPVLETGRPFFPRCLAIFRQYGGYCFGTELLRPDEDPARRAADMILDAVVQLGARPARIVTTRKDLAERLEPLASSLGAKAGTARRLASVEVFGGGLLARAGSGVRRGKLPR